MATNQHRYINKHQLGKVSSRLLIPGFSVRRLGMSEMLLSHPAQGHKQKSAWPYAGQGVEAVSA